MRVEPRLGTKVWFGPRSGPSWGWRPVSPEGWAITIAAVVATLLGTVFSRSIGGSGVFAVRAGSAAVLIVAALLKGSSPGGFGRRDVQEFRRETGRSSSGFTGTAHGPSSEEPHLDDITTRLEHFHEGEKRAQ